jgi:hypothetical protein
MPKRILSNERVVVTRGSGSLGEVGVRRLLGAEPGMPIKAIMVFSCEAMYRDLELKRHKLVGEEAPVFDEDVLA